MVSSKPPKGSEALFGVAAPTTKLSEQQSEISRQNVYTATDSMKQLKNFGNLKKTDKGGSEYRS